LVVGADDEFALALFRALLAGFHFVVILTQRLAFGS
jgi:hypothetical protein